MADQQQPPPAPPPAGRGAAGDDSDEEWARMGLGLGDLGDQRAGDGAGVGGGANHDRPVAADGGNGGGRDLVFDRYGNLRWDGRVPPRPGQAVMAPPVGPANREALDERLPGQGQGQGQGEEQGRDDQNQNQNQNEDQEQEQNQAPEQAVPPPEPQQPVPVDGPSDDDGDDGGGINADDNAGNNDGNENADGGGVRNRNGNENADGGGGGNRVENRHGNGEGGDGEHDDADQINANANADDADANADNDNADNDNADNDNADNDNPDANAHVLEGGVVGTVTDSSGNRLRVSTECELVSRTNLLIHSSRARRWLACAAQPIAKGALFYGTLVPRRALAHLCAPYAHLPSLITSHACPFLFSPSVPRSTSSSK